MSEKIITYPGIKENAYIVTDDGVVKKADGTEIKQRYEKDGYKVVNLRSADGKPRTQKVHRLVAWEFCENDDPEKKPQVNHINEVKDDNRADNLEWCTHTYNINYGMRTSKAIYKREKPIIVKNVNTGDAVRFDSKAQACRMLNLDERHLGDVLAGKRKTTNGYTALYAESPAYDVIPVPVEKIRANTYNPNHVAPPEMKLLYQSIKEDKYTMPIVCYHVPAEESPDGEEYYEIVDGYHRYTTMLTHKDIYEREGGMLPVSVINKPLEDRMASTIRHNRARGSHSIELMTNIVAELTQSGMSDAWILKNLGMDPEELLRLKQLSGLQELFKDKDFSRSWI
jgi:hypothetical protein